MPTQRKACRLQCQPVRGTRYRGCAPSGSDETTEVITVNDDNEPHTIVLKPTHESAKAARDYVAMVVSAWRADDYIPRLVVSELVTNALRVSKPDQHIIVRVFRSEAGETVIEVWDQAEGMPTPLAPALQDEGGRGLIILSDLVVRWGRRPLAHRGTGKVVYAVLAA